MNVLTARRSFYFFFFLHNSTKQIELNAPSQPGDIKNMIRSLKIGA